MDAFHEQKAIARQNREWAEKKKKKKSHISINHPWMNTDRHVAKKLRAMWDDQELPENRHKE